MRWGKANIKGKLESRLHAYYRHGQEKSTQPFQSLLKHFSFPVTAGRNFNQLNLQGLCNFFYFFCIATLLTLTVIKTNRVNFLCQFSQYKIHFNLEK